MSRRRPLAVQVVASERVDVRVRDRCDARDRGSSATTSGLVARKWSIEAVM
jgi:hypothetical protein